MHAVPIFFCFLVTDITLTQVNPQFAELDRREHAHGMMAGYAQQGMCPLSLFADPLVTPSSPFPPPHSSKFIHTDAEECFGQIIHTLRNVPGLPGPSTSISSATVGSEGATNTKKFVEQYLMGQMRRELSPFISSNPFLPRIITTYRLDIQRLKCDEATDEPSTVTHENVLKIECNINISTAFMLTGIMNVCFALFTS